MVLIYANFVLSSSNLYGFVFCVFLSFTEKKFIWSRTAQVISVVCRSSKTSSAAPPGP